MALKSEYRGILRREVESGGERGVSVKLAVWLRRYWHPLLASIRDWFNVVLFVQGFDDGVSEAIHYFLCRILVFLVCREVGNREFLSVGDAVSPTDKIF